MNFAGVFNVSDSDIESFDFNAGGGVTKYLDITVMSSEINFLGRFTTYPVNGFVLGNSRKY